MKSIFRIFLGLIIIYGECKDNSRISDLLTNPGIKYGTTKMRTPG
jgi:hypothetical protein